MAEIFEIPLLNPIPFRKLVEIDDRYNTIPFDLQPTPHTTGGCYYQKWQINDSTKIQVLSDYTPDANQLRILIYGIGSAEIVKTINFTEVVSAIKEQTFKVYEAEFDFSDLGAGYYYANVVYNDESLNEIIHQSQAFQVAETWEDTLLFQYKNSYNDFSIVFEKGIEFDFRIEASLRDFQPQFNAETYTDQEYDARQLSGIPYRNFKLETKNVPDWALDKLNRILNVDEKRIDGVYYEKTDGAKLEIERQQAYPYGLASIDLMPVDNFFLQRLQIDDMAAGEYILIQKVLQYIDNTANRAIVGKFVANTHLTRIAFINKGADAFTLKVGTTEGGSEIGEFDIADTDLTGSLLIGHMFDSAETVYLSGLGDTLLNLFVDYKKYDEDPITINGGSGGASASLLPNTVYWFTEIQDGDLESNWDLASGLGIVGTAFEGCAICDGRGVTPDLSDTTPIGVNLASIITLNTFVGANSKVIQWENMPPKSVNLPNSSVSGLSDNADDRTVMRPTSQQSIQIGGTSVPFDVRQKSYVMLPYIKLP